MKEGVTLPKWLRVLIPSALIVVWLAIGGIGGPYFGKIEEVSSNDQSTFLPSSAESTLAATEIEKFQTQDSIPAIVVFADDQPISQKSIDSIQKARDKLNTLAEVESTSPPITSEDEEAALLVVNIKTGTEYKEFVPELREDIEKAGVTVDFKVTGPAGFLSDLSVAFGGIDGLLLGVALVVVFIILLIVYRSPVLPFIVLLNSMFALSAAILLVYYLAKADVIALNGQVQGILFILVIGAATDYALLFVARYREELERHKEPYQAIMTSWKRSFEPIVAAGGTVIAGLMCLLLSDLNSNKALGPVGSVGIVMAVLSALTLLPSLLLVWGRKVFWPYTPKYSKNKEQTHKGLWPRVGAFVGKHARPIWIGTTAVLIIGSLGILTLKADGVSQSDFILGASEARDGQELLDKHFPGGSGTPTKVVINASALDKAVATLESDKGVASVSVLANDSVSGTMPLGNAKADIQQKIKAEVNKELDSQKQQIRAQIEQQSPGMPSVVVDQIYAQAISNLPEAETIAANAYPFKNATPKVVNNNVVLEVTLTDNADSQAAQDTIVRLRDDMHAIDSQAKVGGVTATQLDAKRSAEHDRSVVIPTVLVVITLILMVLLRSIVAPILLLVTTVLSFVATLGIAAFVFNNLLGLPGADPSVVLFGFIFLVALGIDYNIFLMTRVREESLKIGTHKGVIKGLIVTGGVITSAGIVLAATFAALAVIPILFLAQLAFIVAFGVLLDTIVVRSLLVPALVYDIGKFVWWPYKKRK